MTVRDCGCNILGQQICVKHHLEGMKETKLETKKAVLNEVLLMIDEDFSRDTIRQSIVMRLKDV